MTVAAIDDARRAIKAGDVAALSEILHSNPELATDSSQDRERAEKTHTRTLLHTVADYPGCLPNGVEMARLLLEAGADVNARSSVEGEVTGSALHWSASNDDVDLTEFLLDNGADIDGDRGVISNGTPLWNATIFSCVNVANLLIDRGAARNLMIVAGAGRRELLDAYFDAGGRPAADAGALPCWDEPRSPKAALDSAFGFACRNGQITTASHLLKRGADPTATNPMIETPYKQAKDRCHRTVVDWLEARGIKE